MQNRRHFLKQAAVLSGALGSWHALPESLARALAIEPTPGSTWQDAEHVVILMQENRSFDHLYGALRGVRGFNDPRAITLSNGLPVWRQTDAEGKVHAPFRLDLHHSKSTWAGCLPHSREAETQAFNRGKHDQWATVMRSGRKEYADLPLTLGYYDRRDLPFYYALADSFTVCDQNFCSAMTSTTPNRCYLWSGTSQGPDDRRPRLSNAEIDHDTHVNWTTFPERLEECGLSWRVYQNEIDWLSRELGGEKNRWLGNFGDNPLEYFAQYHVSLADKPAELQRRSPREQALHRRAFTTNRADPNQHELAPMTYRAGDEVRTVAVPQGDVFFQFRQDVQRNQLPAVSWLVAPENFSDHPSAPWYGAWYVSEALSILTQSPALWRKTIFILTYDENDGYFDHIPPFIPPRAGAASTGAVSASLDTSREYDGDLPIGLGYRVPLVIASPWTRGGRVCSQVFDHTSVVQFLELFASHKTGKVVRESNLSSWRRAVCGNLTSAFAPEGRPSTPFPQPIASAPFVAEIHQAQFLPPPRPGEPLSPEALESLRENPRTQDGLPRQEPGTRPSCALPYQLNVEGRLDRARKTFDVAFTAKNEFFGSRSAGAPFNVYGPSQYGAEKMTLWSYAAQAGESVTDAWSVEQFEDSIYHLRVYGPNGFYREFRGDLQDPALAATCDEQVDADRKPTGNLVLAWTNAGAGPMTVAVEDLAYGAPTTSRTLAPGESTHLVLDLTASSQWYDFRVSVAGQTTFLRSYAGRVETGAMGVSDPAMAGVERPRPNHVR